MALEAQQSIQVGGVCLGRSNNWVVILLMGLAGILEIRQLMCGTIRSIMDRHCSKEIEIS